MLSTFTYTNAVPQIAVFNSGQWAQYERRIREYATNNCSPQGGDLYLIRELKQEDFSRRRRGEIREGPGLTSSFSSQI